MTQIYDLIQSIQGGQENLQKQRNQPEGGGETRSFGDTMNDFLESVNESKKEASQSVADVIEGRSDNMAQAMVKMEESKISFELMIEIRTKLLEAYQEISRMQV